MIWTVKAILAWTTQYFAKLGLDSPRVDAELLLARVLDCNRVRLYIDQDKPLGSAELALMHKLVERRSKHEPMAYILGSKGFMNDDFLVNSDVLIPRPETELLVEGAAKIFANEEVKFLDIGTGSGAIAVSLAKMLPKSRAVAVDISKAVLAVAQKNAQAIAVADKITFLESDLFSALGVEKFDLIISNPPYISADDMNNLEQDVQQEPVLALFGGVDGLDFYRRIIANADRYLAEEGVLAFEFGFGQGAAIQAMLQQKGFDIVKVIKDYAGIERDIFATKNGLKYADKILELK